MPSSSSNKRTQAVPAKQRSGHGKNNKTPRNSPPKDKDNNHPSSLNAPVTTASSASKRVAKAVRSAGAGAGGGGKSTKGKTNNKMREGPEAERSDEEDVLVYPDGGASDDSEDDDDADDVNGEDDNLAGIDGNIGDNVEGDTTPEPEEKRVSTNANGNGNGKQKRVVLGVEGKSVPKSEIGMDALLAGAKPRPESHNITRGYEFISSPASRLIIPVEKAIGLNLNKRGRMRRHDSIASTDSEWEKVQFEMDASVDAFSDSESLSLSQRDISRKKKAYADVVKRNYTLPPVAAAS